MNRSVARSGVEVRLPQSIFCPRAPFFRRKLTVKKHIFLQQNTCYGQFVSVLEIVCPSWTVCVCRGQSVSVTIIFSSTINTFFGNMVCNTKHGWKNMILGKIVHEI